MTTSERSDAFTKAKRLAKYGHKDQIVWSTDKGDFTEKLTASSMKQCLLETGFKHKWWLVHANSATGQVGSWRFGILLLRNLRYG